MRRVGRAVALAALLPCFALAAPAPLTPPATAAPPATAQAKKRAQVGIGLTKVGPKTVRADSKIEISGLAKNRTGDQLAGLTLRLRYSAQPVLSRSQLDQFATGQPNLLPNVGPQQPLASVASPGATQEWTFRTTAKALRLNIPTGAPGVYPVGVEVLNPAQQVVGGLTTFLTAMPKQRHFKPVAVSWVWPLVDRMHRTGDRAFFDDALTGDMSPDGRLGSLVDAAAATDTPVTWGIDPALLDDAQRMASGKYAVQPFGAPKATQKEKSTVAASWLAALKNASKGDPYFTLPYGDPDVVALIRHKMPRDIGLAFAERNTGVATQVLGRAADAGVAWPVYGAGGPGTLEQLAGHALKDGGSFLMSSSQFQPPQTGELPNATTRVRTRAGERSALLFDEKLNKIVSEGSETSYGAQLTEQRFLAETAMIAAEAPNQQRSVVVAPDRHWNPAPGLAEKLLKYTGDAAWLRDLPLDDIESAAPQARAFNGYPDSFERFELGDAHLAQIRTTARRAATFREVMTNDINISYERALLRLTSVSWRAMPGRAKQARNALTLQLDDDMSQVRIVTTKNKRVLMGGSSGKLPVLVENTLHDQSVKVRLVATSENTAKLQLAQLEPEEAVIELRPGERAQRWIPAQAAGNGNFRVRLDLAIPDSGGRTLGDGETITVVTTGYGRIALLITGGGLAVLFVGVGVRAIRARRRRKAEAAGDGAGPAGTPPGTGEQGYGFPGAGLAGPGLPTPGLSGTGLPGTGPSTTGPPTTGPSTTGPSTTGRPPGSPADPAGNGAPGTGTAADGDGISEPEPEPAADGNSPGRRTTGGGDPSGGDRD
ncbi:hypothetical protein E1200_24160 [Actinomadura sp. GC306]|uniref:DUF6049 family protein n=1 Tax=Actinomadura sp. GC306 TaxID=2530367 RepID=UPI0010444317|nr:DUF6049 family protein [Actinomadura sp. GC306]TDC62901.1 hypothetical protein E1200_24160 [Actinomadura sp. GC306]